MKTKATAGEAIAAWAKSSLWLGLQTEDEDVRDRDALARKIDTAINRAVKKALEAERSRAETAGYFDAIVSSSSRTKKDTP